MAAAGLVRREPYPGDRRGYYAVMTEEGKGVLERAAAGHSRGVAEHFFRHLNAEDIRVLGAVLTRVLQGHEEALRDAGCELVLKPASISPLRDPFISAANLTTGQAHF